MKKIVMPLLLISSGLEAQFQLPQIYSNNTAVPFLLISPDARAGGMGDGGIAIANDASAIHWNLSSLSFAKHRIGISISYAPWLRSLVPDINFAHVGFFTKPDSISVVAASVRYFSYGNVMYTNATGTIISQFKPNEFSFDAGYARKVGKQFAIGMVARMIRSNLTNGITIAGQATKPGNGFAIDINTTYHGTEIIKDEWIYQAISGLSLSNIGPKMSYIISGEKWFLPTKLGIAQSIRMKFKQKHVVTGHLELSRLLVPVSGNTQNGLAGELKKIMVSAGMEFDVSGIFKFRTGYFFEHESLGNLQYMTFGFGITYNVFQVDFAYLHPTNDHRNPLQETLRFTLMFNFGKLKIEPRPHGLK